MIAVDSWQPADGLTLEPNALRASKEQVSCLALTAGPGAGKTEMLAQRADFLLRTGTCRYPKRILAISFKVDASKNLKERVRRRCGSGMASRFDSYTFHAFAKRIIDRFRIVLVGDDALDVGYGIGDRRVAHKQITFDDLVPFAVQILRSSKVARNAVRQTYTDVFLDEFQDCTRHQYELIKVAFMGTDIRLTSVGDTKQKIMGFAGALDGIFKTFADDFQAIPLNMYRNFRSQPRLLRMQNEIIRALDPASVMPDDQLEGGAGDIAVTGLNDGREEAQYIADLVETWVRNEHIPLAEVAVLVAKMPEQYTDHLMGELEAKGIPFRNENKMQDITVEPVARLIVDYLSCLYGRREPKAWIRLMEQLVPFADDEVQFNIRKNWQNFVAERRKEVGLAQDLGEPWDDWWESVRRFLKRVGRQTVTALSPDYESYARLKEIIRDTKTRIEELLQLEPDLPKALERFSDDQAVRIMSIHKSKGLEFDSVVIMAVENETFFGDPEEELCAFFVGVSRAKRRLVLTHVEERERPVGYTRFWKSVRSAQNEFLDYALPFV